MCGNDRIERINQVVTLNTARCSTASSPSSRLSGGTRLIHGGLVLLGSQAQLEPCRFQVTFQYGKLSPASTDVELYIVFSQHIGSPGLLIRHKRLSVGIPLDHPIQGTLER